MESTRTARRTFVERANDLRCRDWTCRAARFARARARSFHEAGQLLADDPRVVKAWIKGWDGSHYVRLSRWRDEGFRPDVVYDIGANRGSWTAMCQELFSPTQIFLFEPQPELVERAMDARPAHAQWRLFPVGLGAEAASGTLHLTSNQAASSLLPPIEGVLAESCGAHATGNRTVRVEALDQLAVREALPLPDLVKIDVQGFEGAVLSGGRMTLARARRIIVETSLRPVYRDQSLLPEVLRQVNDWGFQLDDITETFREWPGPLMQADLWLRR